MQLILIRHSEPDYSFIDMNMNYQWCNLAPLTNNGKQIAINSRKEKILEDGLILASPYTRALQTAYLIFPNRDIIIEPRLHEWLPDKYFTSLASDFHKLNQDYKNNNGISNKNENWESDIEMKIRINSVIDKYKNEDKLIIVAHERIINMLLPKRTKIPYCGINIINI